MTDSPVVETSVLVVGAGPAGAAAGALLGTYGVPAVVLNKHGSVATSPRAHITNQRTMEVLRDLGIEDEAVRLATPQRLMGEHVWATSLAGPEIGRMRTWHTHPLFQAEHDLASPSAVCDLPQDLMEPLLLRAATLRGTRLLTHTELLSFVQDDDGVTSTVLDRTTRSRFTIRSSYLIAADGANSTVVSQLQIPTVGWRRPGTSVNILFEADLTHLVADRPGDMYWILQPGVGRPGKGIGVLRMIRPWTRWIADWGYLDDDVPELTEEFGTAIAHQLIGDDTIPVRVESLSPWSVSHVYATENHVGRVFCVGDAVHRHSPMNGLGSNTSIQDSFNLCWKLALVLGGRADPALLGTFREERLPVARQVVERAQASSATIPAILAALELPTSPGPGALDDALARLEEPSAEGTRRRAALDGALRGTFIGFNAHGVEMNQRYRSGAVATGGVPEPVTAVDEEVHYVATTQPGRHLPHAWLLDGRRRIPVIDLCGRGRFTLLVGVRGADWRAAAARAADELGVAIDVVSIGRGCDYRDGYGDWAAVSGIDETGALLVRPDHIVGWRCASAPADSDEALSCALGSILRGTAA